MPSERLPDFDAIPKQLWTDDELSGRIYLQACHLYPKALLTTEEFDGFFEAMFSAMHKITATKYHLENYRRIEKEQFREARRAFRRKSVRRREAFELIFELEAFLFQVKSSLDMMVKILDPILGKGAVSTQTFGACGDRVVKGLGQYKRRKGASSEAVDRLIEICQADKHEWLELVVEVRDRLSHTEGIRDFEFEPAHDAAGQVTAKCPQFSFMGTVPFMELVYTNNLEFQQDFMSLAYGIRAAQKALHLVIVDESVPMGFFGKDRRARFVKYGLALPPADPIHGATAAAAVLQSSADSDCSLNYQKPEPGQAGTDACSEATNIGTPAINA